MFCIPQELFDLIVDEVCDHRDLKACALVSRSFVRSSQKHLFHSITIDSMATSQGLSNLLSSNPAISSYIWSLTIVPRPVRMPSDETSWIVHDQKVTCILYKLMPQIRQLQLGLGNKYHPHAALFDWALFPPAFQSALQSQVYKLSNLSTLNILRISHIPVFLLFAPVKRLSLGMAKITDTDADEPWANYFSMARLESLDLQMGDADLQANPNHTWPQVFCRASNLRRLSVLLDTWSGIDCGLRVGHQVIEAASKSLNNIAWLMHDLRYMHNPQVEVEQSIWPRLNLGSVSNLTTLSLAFVVLSSHKGPIYFSTAIKMLKDPFVMRNLKDLTFTFEFEGLSSSSNGLYSQMSRMILCSSCDAWTEFDHMFEAGPGIPTLRNPGVYLRLIEPPSRAADAKLQALFVSKLPAVNKQVTMLCKTDCSDD